MLDNLAPYVAVNETFLRAQETIDSALCVVSLLKHRKKYKKKKKNHEGSISVVCSGRLRSNVGQVSLFCLKSKL